MYESMTSLTAGLELGERGGLAELVAGDRPVARFDIDRGAVRSFLLTPVGNAIDLSRQPAVFEMTVATVARRRLANVEGWTAAAAAGLARWSTEQGIPVSGGLGLTATLMRVGFPVVRQAAANGLGVPEQVPSWAVESLRSATARAALETALGRRCGRPVVRAFARSLGEGREHFSVVPLALVIAARRIGDDRLARLVDTRADAAALGPVPDRRDIHNLASCFGRMRLATAERVAVEALTTTGALHRLVEAATVLRLVDEDHGALPGSLDELERLVRAVVPVAPDHRRAVRRRRRPRAAPPAPPPAPPDRRLPAQPLRAPAGDRGAPPARFDYGEATLRLAGHAFGGLRFVLPARPVDLRLWGDFLGNCLADYVPAVAAGRSIVIGVEERGLLLGALELDPGMRYVRQFVGERNRAPSRRLDTAVERELQRFGVRSPAAT